MKHLQEFNYYNEIERMKREVHFMEAEFNELLDCEVSLNESSEMALHGILNDVFKRLRLASEALSNANRANGTEERTRLKQQAFTEMNRSRNLLSSITKEFPVDANVQRSGNSFSSEFISPSQAADTLGIPTSKLQNYVSANRLKMYNDNGRWALKGSEVQDLADWLRNGGEALELKRKQELQSRYTNRAKFDI